MTREQPVIVIDTREQTPWVFSAEVRTQPGTLMAGDYSILGATELVSIERKSLADLVHCSGADHERFCDQMRRLREYAFRALIVEASLDDVLRHRYRSRTLPNSVVGCTIALMADYGVPCIWAGSPAVAARWAERFLVRVLRTVQKEASHAA